MLYGENEDRVPEIVEAEAVVANPQPVLRRFNILEALHVTLAGSKIASNQMQDAQGGVLVDGSEVGLCLVRPGNFLDRHDSSLSDLVSRRGE
jgi:hypothetical protein